MDWTTFFATLAASGALSGVVSLLIAKGQSNDSADDREVLIDAQALEREKWETTQRKGRLEQLRTLEDAVLPFLQYVVDTSENNFNPAELRPKALEVARMARFAGEGALTNQLDDLAELLVGPDLTGVAQRARFAIRTLNDAITLAGR